MRTKFSNELTDAEAEASGMIVDSTQLIRELNAMKDRYHGAYHPSDCNCPRCYPSEKDILIDQIVRKIKELRK